MITPETSRFPRLSGRRRRALAATGAAIVSALALVGCQSGGSTGSDGAVPAATAATATVTASVPAELTRFYEQKASWYPCGPDAGMTESSASEAKGFTCATIEVPVDYSDPSGQTVKVAMKKLAATGGDAVGTLFINPGGPGGSGVDLVQSADGYFSDTLLKSYDVVGFDPRGVGSSTAVDCLTDAELDAERAGDDEEPIAEETSDAAAQADVADYASGLEKKCESRTEPAALLDHIDTISAAKDLDVMRAVEGQSALTYLGFSYGTYLGATYAELFPGNVGRLVLDGAIDPSLSAADLTLGQAKGFESALRAYVKDCQAGSDCPLAGSVDDGVKQVRDLLESTRTSPIPTSDDKRPLTFSLAQDAVLGVLYQSESWSVLSQGLDQAMNQNDGSTLLYIADVFASRNDDGTYSGNGDEVINAINCLDYPVEGDAATWNEEEAELKKASPTFGAGLGYSDLFCKAWGHTSTRTRGEIHAKGAAPILVVGTTGDPATPYPWAQSLAKQLDSGHLLTWKGEGHTAYGRAGDCVTKAVDAYLLAGQLPEEGKTCEGSE
ncbi:alpha/beta hydrolase [Actinomyces radicidentis]|uniref:alpha/beta hydrolase n=1 Tax=Actinomyces radicidentis TaxID=111015 RepID=UPI000B05613E|nr:alpha/beta hydrolase [Actinomyces radicidentis]